MADELAQIYIDGRYPDNATKALATGIINPVPAGADKLTGKLVIENFPNITGINLRDQKLTELEIKNCPNLTTIVASGNGPHLKVLNFDKIIMDATGNPLSSNLTSITCPNNRLEELSFKYCPKLQVLYCQGNPGLNWLRWIEELESLTTISLPNVRLLHKDKLEYFRDVVKAVREVLEIDRNDSLPKDAATQKLIIDTLKERIKKSVIVQIEREEGIGFKALKQQLASIVTKLGLAENATEQQILDKIGELMNRPSSVVVDQKNSEIAQKDSKISELEQQLAAEKQKNAELQNQIDDSVTREVIEEEIGNNLENLGISSVARTARISSAPTAVAAMSSGNKIFKEEWKRVRDAQKQSFYLNIALIGLLSLALVALTWLIMKESKLSIKEEDKKKIKK